MSFVKWNSEFEEKNTHLETIFYYSRIVFWNYWSYILFSNYILLLRTILAIGSAKSQLDVKRNELLGFILKKPFQALTSVDVVEFANYLTSPTITAATLCTMI